MEERKKNILFLGALKSQTKDGSLGGLLFACRSLAESLRSVEYNVIELNTTYKTKGVGNKVGKFNKIKTLLSRNIYFYYKIILQANAKTILIFASAGNSFIEKSYLIRVGKLLGKRVILFPRSGHLLTDFEKKKYISAINNSLEKSNYVICQSRFWKNYFKDKGVAEQKLIVVENWYPTNLIAKSKKLSFKTYLNKELHIIFMARLEEGKGIEDLLKFAKEYGGNYKIKIDIYGIGTYEKELRKKTKDYDVGNIIKFRGWLSPEEKLEKINEYDLAVFTSRFEGYPNTLLDYIFAKTPVLTTDIESIKAVGKEHFIYYEPGNIDDLNSKISYIFDSYPQLLISSKELYKEKSNKNNITYSSKKILNILNYTE